MLQQTKPSQHPASSPSRPRRPRAERTQGSGSHRGLQPRGPAARRRLDCRKPLLTPRFDRLRGQDRGGSCVQEEGEYEWVSDHGGKPGSEEQQIEPAILVQPLNGEAGKGEEAATLGSAVPFCEGGSKGPCGSDVLAPPPCVATGCSRGERHRSRHRGGGGIVEKCAHGAAKGAVTGAAGGAAAGAVGGEGAGAGPGAVAGAVGGAVAGCLSEVIP
jgi:hypothetical protein